MKGSLRLLGTRSQSTKGETAERCGISSRTSLSEWDLGQQRHCIEDSDSDIIEEIIASVENNKAMFGNGANQVKEEVAMSSEGKFKYKCHNCGKPGHMKKDCRSKKRDQKEKPTGGMLAGPVAFVATPNTLTAMVSNLNSKPILVDSGASEHMFLDKNNLCPKYHL